MNRKVVKRKAVKWKAGNMESSKIAGESAVRYGDKDENY